MQFVFSTLDSLTLALTSGAIPAKAAAAPVEAAIAGNDTAVFADLSAAAKKRLRAIGVAEIEDDGRPRQAFACWPQLLPLVRRQPAWGDKTPVLFDVAGGGAFAELAAEMLRLGNDRQSFRQLSDGQAPRTLLRVLSPPYYTLLRSLEAGGQPPGSVLTAFIEQRPRVWVELGHEHPLAEQLQPPAGQWLLLRAPRSWELLDEGPFEEIYQAIEFQVPAAESSWREQPLEHRLSVPLRLTSMAETDPAELWVLEQDALQQVEQLVAHSDNELIGRLAFAVVAGTGAPAERVGVPSLGTGVVATEDQTRTDGTRSVPTTLVLLRVRPSKLPPPVLILAGTACRSYLNLPNLFVPVGRRLHPPLRRDVVNKLLAPDANQLVWLQPGEGGGFTPRSVADAAFRPLAQWVDYVLDQAHQPLTAWMAAHRFDFASFICEDDAPGRQRLPPKRQEARPAQSPPQTAANQPQQAPAGDEPVLAEIALPEGQPAAELAKGAPQPSELQQRLSAAESTFVALQAPLESPARVPLWREMAWLNGALDRRLDAALCWSHALWENAGPATADAVAWISQWEGGESFPAAAELKKLLADLAPPRLALTRLAVQLVGQANGKGAPCSAEQLALAAQVLTKHDGALPIRVVWLAWLALAQLTHGDALALARARDRILERLFQQGLTVEHDLPGFLRGGSGADASRHRVLREQLLVLRDEAAEWIVEPPYATSQTRAYADLIFAFGLARLGEIAESQRIVGWARQKLSKKDNVHAWTLAAFEHRIAVSAYGLIPSNLQQESLALLELMERNDRYRVDKLRQRSRLIEPLERIDSYRNFHRRYADEFTRELAQLFDIIARDELHAKLRELLTRPPPAARQPLGQLRLIAKALELSPRVGESLAVDLLGRVLPAFSGISDVVEQAVLLEKALLVAAHFDQRDTMHVLLEQFDAALPGIVGNYLRLQSEHLPDNHEKLENIESLFRQSLRGLRKLGLRDEIGRMFSRIVDLVQADLRGKPPVPASGRPAQRDPARAAKLQLTVAGGWFYFGQHEQAQPIVEQSRRLLFESEMPAVQKSTLACAYLAAVAQAPLTIALPLIQELFGKNPKTQVANLSKMVDPLVTSSHFSLAQLDVVEAAVLTLVSDEFVLSQEIRQWLEEDEYLVRRRIHRDVREMVGA